MEKQTERLHFIMAFIGGWLGVYALLHFANLFGSAQTSNLIAIVTCLLGGNFGEFALRLGGMALYMAAVALATWLPHHLSADLRVVSLGIDGAAAVILGLFPAEIPPVLGLYPLFFAMAFQWCSFPGAHGFVSATIFSTNNLRQFTSAVTEVYLNHDPSYRLKARFFGLTLLSFHAGVAVSYLLWDAVGFQAAWLCLIPILAAFGMVRRSIQTVPDAEPDTEVKPVR